MSAVNYAEVFTHYAKLGSSKADIADVVDSLPIEIVPLDADLARMAGMLRPLTIEAGLSLGDRCCLALAIRSGLSAWTADNQWKLVATTVGVKVTQFVSLSQRQARLGRPVELAVVAWCRQSTSQPRLAWVHVLSLITSDQKRQLILKRTLSGFIPDQRLRAYRHLRA